MIRADGRVFRALSSQALEDWRALSETAAYALLPAERRLVATDEVPEGAPPPVPDGSEVAPLLEHEPIPFVSYLYESERSESLAQGNRTLSFARPRS